MTSPDPSKYGPVDVTLWVAYDKGPDGLHRAVGPDGRTALAYLCRSGMYGIPIPERPRTGPLGLSEARTRSWADRRTAAEAKAAGGHLLLNAIDADTRELLIPLCRAAVAEWDSPTDTKEGTP